MKEQWRELQFEPWVGPEYGQFEGMKVLVLGEAHYGADPSAPTSRDLTRRVISGEATRGPTKSFLTKVARLLLRDRRASSSERRSALDQVAFYNFVQRWVGEGARKAPSDIQWREAEELFGVVMRELKPDAVLVLGKRLWKRVPVSERESGSLGDAECVGHGRYPLGSDRNSRLLAIHHPSAGGFKYARWMPAIEALVTGEGSTQIA